MKYCIFSTEKHKKNLKKVSININKYDYNRFSQM